MNKYIPDYLEEFSEAFQTFNEALKEVCKKLDLITDAIYGTPDLEELVQEPDKVEEPAEIADNNEEEKQYDYVPEDKQTSTPKKRGRKPKE